MSLCLGSGMGAAAVFERGDEDDKSYYANPSAYRNTLSADAIIN